MFLEETLVLEEVAVHREMATIVLIRLKCQVQGFHWQPKFLTVCHKTMTDL